MIILFFSIFKKRGNLTYAGLLVRIVKELSVKVVKVIEIYGFKNVSTAYVAKSVTAFSILLRIGMTVSTVIIGVGCDR